MFEEKPNDFSGKYSLYPTFQAMKECWRSIMLQPSNLLLKSYFTVCYIFYKLYNFGWRLNKCVWNKTSNLTFQYKYQLPLTFIHSFLSYLISRWNKNENLNKMFIFNRWSCAKFCSLFQQSLVFGRQLILVI